MPSSYGASAPGSFLSHFGPDDQLFQRPMLNNLGQNYVPNPRPPPPPLPLPPPPPQQQQRDVLFDQAQRTTYAPPRNYYLEQQQQQMAPPQPPNPFIEYQRAPPQLNPADHQELFFTDHSDEQVEQQQQQQQQPQLSHRHSDYQDQDSRRQGKLIILIKAQLSLFIQLFGMNYNEPMLKFMRKTLIKNTTNQPLEIELHLVPV